MKIQAEQLFFNQFPIAHKKSLIENYTRAKMAKYKGLEMVWTTQDLTFKSHLFYRQASCILDSPLNDKENSASRLATGRRQRTGRF